MLASELWAVSQSARCEGPDRCHWCSAPCKRLWPHDDVPIQAFVKSSSTALCPANSYVCPGCWTFRRKRSTVRFLRMNEASTAHAFKDGQSAEKWSWWITEDGAWAIDPLFDRPLLWDLLIKPPKRFVLSLLEGVGTLNLLQLMVANDLAEIKADTSLTFTVNGVPHAYNVYDLEHTINTGDPSGKAPGVSVLLRLLGTPPERLKEEPKKLKRGRQYAEDVADGRNATRIVQK